jgi:hypothetical protein
LHQESCQAKSERSGEYLLIRKEAVKKSPRIAWARAGVCFFDWTIHRAAGILIARWGHL